jgi:hypothetical protein
MKKHFYALLFVIPLFTLAQTKKPLDHSVYDSWQSIGEKVISNNGKYVVYTITPQEGDAKLVIQRTSGQIISEISRGYNAAITEDNKYVLFKIKPWFKDTREAKIKKKKPEEMPKDSLALISLEDERRNKLYARVKSFKMPEDAAGWAAFLYEKPEAKKIKDSTAPTDKKTDLENADVLADEDIAGEKKEDGADLVLKNLQTGEERIFKNAVEYFFNKTGNKLVLEISPSKKRQYKGIRSVV